MAKSNFVSYHILIFKHIEWKNSKEFNGSGAIEAARKSLDDLSGLNGRIGDCMAVNAAKMVSTVDLLTGVHSAAGEVQMDGLNEFWSNDPVHGDKLLIPRLRLFSWIC